MGTRKISMLCLFCEKSLSIPLRLLGWRFCSRSHEREYVKRMDNQAVKGLHEIACHIRDWAHRPSLGSREDLIAAAMIARITTQQRDEAPGIHQGGGAATSAVSLRSLSKPEILSAPENHRSSTSGLAKWFVRSMDWDQAQG
jgi:hypothetical protein